jgi:hypothetical protein
VQAKIKAYYTKSTLNSTQPIHLLVFKAWIRCWSIYYSTLMIKCSCILHMELMILETTMAVKDYSLNMQISQCYQRIFLICLHISTLDCVFLKNVNKIHTLIFPKNQHSYYLNYCILLWMWLTLKDIYWGVGQTLNFNSLQLMKAENKLSQAQI